MKVLSVVGRLGKDPELKFSQGGLGILNASVACDYQKKTREGGYERATQWVRVVVFGKRAESLNKVLQKGMRVAATGDLSINEYEKDGSKRFAVEVIANDIEPLFDKRADGGAGERRVERSEPEREYADSDDDIPF